MTERYDSHREFWVFQVPAADLVQAVDRKVAHHQGRLAHWEKRMREDERKLREEGIVLDDSTEVLDPRLTYTAYAHTPSQAFQQPVLQQRFVVQLRQAQNKVLEHRQKLEQYQEWQAVLRYGGPRPYELTFEDAVFFGL